MAPHTDDDDQQQPPVDEAREARQIRMLRDLFAQALQTCHLAAEMADEMERRRSERQRRRRLTP